MPSEQPIDHAKRIIGTYPEVFDSLLEFEKTKKLPKLYRRRRIDVTIDENVLRDFRSFSEKRAITLSRFIESAMIKKMQEG